LSLAGAPREAMYFANSSRESLPSALASNSANFAASSSAAGTSSYAT
jgi:hypothetical protein